MNAWLKRFTLFFGILLSFCAFAQAEDPLATIKSTIDKCKETVVAKRTSLTPEQLTAELEKIVKPVFDFREMARRCLGSNWNEGTPEQQKEFSDLFSDLLSSTYMHKVIDDIAETEISYPEQKVEGDKAVVKTKILDKGDIISVDYRLQQIGGKWLAYDVIIENVGLVSNYRTEFAGIIRKEGFGGLITRLKEKKLNK